MAKIERYKLDKEERDYYSKLFGNVLDGTIAARDGLITKSDVDLAKYTMAWDPETKIMTIDMKAKATVDLSDNDDEDLPF